jgi:hypothetical protein
MVWLRRALVSLALAGALAAAGCAAGPTAPPRVEFLGPYVYTKDAVLDGTAVGGLSGIDYDRANDLYYVISDDRSDFNPARFYTAKIDVSAAGIRDVSFVRTRPMQQADGTAFPKKTENPLRTVDPEAIRLNARTGTLYWSSEGDKSVPVDPFVREMTTDGRFVREFALPPKFKATNASDATQGIRDNLAFEALTLSADGTKLFVANENALYQDGPAANLGVASPVRVLRYDIATGRPEAEFVYICEPVVKVPTTPTGYRDNGLPEMLALDDNRLLMLERGFSAGAGNTIKLFIATFDGASDVSGLPALAGQSYTPMTKTLLLDFETLGTRLDNMEGMTFGPTLPDGRRVLIIVSDNNFNARQITLFLAFAVSGL